MGRIVIVSNRLPVRIQKDKANLEYLPSEGGLATGLGSLDESFDKVWVGWPGYTAEEEVEQQEIIDNLQHESMVPVFLAKQDIEEYYEGFSNETIWPLFHYFTEYTHYDRRFWEAYKRVSRKFADVVKTILQPGDTVWIQDYQLFLLPQMVRDFSPDISIGFFLHIPFPSYEVFRILPWRVELLQGVLGADLIGFHTYEYMRHFLSAVYRILGIDQNLGQLTIGSREVKVNTFPMGIDYHKYHEAPNIAEIYDEANTYRFRFGNTKLILSIDRLDYTKGILQRLKAFDSFLENNPDYEGKVSLILVVVPSRSGVEQYKHLKEEIDEMVGRINGKFSALDWSPIHYFYRSLPFHSLTALYMISDVALVTPLRDGMNLIAKEYLACRRDSGGVLILSEMAGASIDLSEALIINPNSTDEIVSALQRALNMPQDEQVQRNRIMQNKIREHNVKWWARKFINELSKVREEKTIPVRRMETAEKQQLVKEYQSTTNRLLLIDYDGTLVSFKDKPEKAVPDEALLKIVNELADDPSNYLVIISGRDKDTLQSWIGKNPNINIVAEHGVWLKEKDTDWEMIKQMNNAWKKDIYPILQEFVDNTPGSFIEEKDYSLVWHYRKSDKWIADIRVGEMINALMNPLAQSGLQLLKGNKVIEVKVAGVSKGSAVIKWIDKLHPDFILCIGDDWTDEYMFRELPDTAYTIKVRLEKTSARYTLKDPQEVRQLLEMLASQVSV